MKKNYCLIFILFILSGCSREKSEQPLSPAIEAAKNKAMMLCAGCHGPQGIGTADINPNLACQKKEYMVRQLNFYRDGTRTTHPPMTNIARMLSEDEVVNISEWYSKELCQSDHKK